MNVNVQASEIEAAEPIGKLEGAAPKRARKPKVSFAELAAGYRANISIYYDNSVDDSVAQKFLDKAFNIAKIMTRPDVPMTEQD